MHLEHENLKMAGISSKCKCKMSYVKRLSQEVCKEKYFVVANKHGLEMRDLS